MTKVQYQELRIRMPEIKLPPHDWLSESTQARLWQMSKEQVIASRVTQKLEGVCWPWSKGRLVGHQWQVDIGL